MKQKKIKNLSEKELESICRQNICYCNCPLEINKGHDNIRLNSVCIKHIIANLEEFRKRIEELIVVEENA